MGRLDPDRGKRILRRKALVRPIENLPIAQLSSPAQGQASRSNAAQRESKHFELLPREDPGIGNFLCCEARMLLCLLSLCLWKRRPVGNLRGSADNACSLLEKISPPYAILAAHKCSVVGNRYPQWKWRRPTSSTSSGASSSSMGPGAFAPADSRASTTPG